MPSNTRRRFGKKFDPKRVSRGNQVFSCRFQLFTVCMESWNITEFRKRLLARLDQLPAEGVLVTRRGKPVAKVLPLRKDNSDLIGALAGQFEIRGDIFSTGERWEAES